MDPIEQFKGEKRERVNNNAQNEALRDAADSFLLESIRSSYSYNFEWLSRPIIQYPQDMVAVQELIWRTRPDLIIETGVAHGGSLLLSASMLVLLDYCDAASSNAALETRRSRRRVIGIDIDIRPHNRRAIEVHPLSHKIELIQGSSIAPEVTAAVAERAAGYERVLVMLDSNHTHTHVLAELVAYAPFVSSGSYCVVFDTVIERLPNGLYPERSWGSGDNPMTAVGQFLNTLNAETVLGQDGTRLCFEVDTEIDNKLLVSVAPGGYLRRLPIAR